jgi:hypothetical protein
VVSPKIPKLFWHPPNAETSFSSLGSVLSFHTGHFGGQETPIVSVPKMLSATFAHPNLFYKLAKKLKEVNTLEKLHMTMADA